TIVASATAPDSGATRAQCSFIVTEERQRPDRARRLRHHQPGCARVREWVERTEHAACSALLHRWSDPNCEQEGAYPAVDRRTGDVYVAWEFNWVSNISAVACASPATPIHNVLARIPG